MKFSAGNDSFVYESSSRIFVLDSLKDNVSGTPKKRFCGVNDREVCISIKYFITISFSC